MLIRKASEEDAEAACVVLRRSITELCVADHQNDAATLAQWLANKTPRNVIRWVGETDNCLLVADDGGAILGVAAMRNSGRISLNYVSPESRFRGVSKALVSALEAHARQMGLDACTLESTATARQFYHSIGYADCAPAAHGFGITLGYPMRKRLSR
jgi:GNAT superfamily N-acetyltransferase